MSSNIRVQRICEFCKNTFIAHTYTTRYCSHKCNSKHYKAKKREEKSKLYNQPKTSSKKNQLELSKKEFLTVKEVSVLLNCSVRSTYIQITNGTIKAVNLGQRMTRIKRSEIDKLFNK